MKEQIEKFIKCWAVFGEDNMRSDLYDLLKEAKTCRGCGTPLSDYCPRCKHLLES